MGEFGAINASNRCNHCSMTVSFFSKVQTRPSQAGVTCLHARPSQDVYTLGRLRMSTRSAVSGCLHARPSQV